MHQTTRTSHLVLIPLILTYFAMGFVDLVGIASNYLKVDLGLTDAEANIFPSLVFFWFLIFAVPTGMLMNRIGRRKTVVLSLAITAVSLVIPIFSDAYMVMLVSFSLLGIGNALMQTSTNPLLSTIVSGDKLASSLTFGQFVKAIASFLAPYIAMWGSTQAIPDLYGVCGDCCIVVRCDADCREANRGQAFHVWPVPFFVRQSLYPTLLYRYHVPCRLRRRYEHHCSKDSDGAFGYGSF